MLVYPAQHSTSDAAPAPNHMHQQQHQQQQHDEHITPSTTSCTGISDVLPRRQSHEGQHGRPMVAKAAHTFRRAQSSNLDYVRDIHANVDAGGLPTLVELQGYRSSHLDHELVQNTLHPDQPLLVPAAYTFVRSPQSAGPSSPLSTHSALSPKPPLSGSTSIKVHAHAGASHGGATSVSSIISSRRDAQWHALYKHGSRASHFASCQASEDEESSDEHDAITQQLMAAVVQQERRSHHSRHHSWHIKDNEVPSGGGGSPSASAGGAAPHHMHHHNHHHHHHPHSRFSGEDRSLAHEEQQDHTLSPVRLRSSYHLQSNQAAVELFLRLGRARQTVDFSKRQAALFTAGQHGRYSIWEALHLLNELREYESVLFKHCSSSGGNLQLADAASLALESMAPYGEDPEFDHRPLSRQPSTTTLQPGTMSRAPSLATLQVRAVSRQPSLAALYVGGDESAHVSSPSGTQLARTGSESSPRGGVATGPRGSHEAASPKEAGVEEGPGDMSLLEHALQTAELCRERWPGKDHLHLAGLIHSLGKLLAHKRWGSQPQWAVCGETFPLGCRFSPSISGAQFFSANPDRRRRLYSMPTGMYQPQCGLHNVTMSWSACEYLFQILVQNKTTLPEEALFMLRFYRCMALTRSGGEYEQLLDESDRARLPTLQEFQQLTEFKRRPFAGAGTEKESTELITYYDSLINKYMPDSLAW